MYRIYRPSPLCRAYNLERALGTPAKIYYKFEGNNTSGSHKLNSAIAQAYYAKAQELTGITTETGAGQWGTALAEAADHFGLNLDVFMVKCSYEQKPFRRNIMETFKAESRPRRRTPRPSAARCFARASRFHGIARHGHLRGGGARAEHVPRTRGATRWAACSTRWCCTSRVIGLESYAALRRAGRIPRRRHRLRGRRLEPGRPHRAVHARQAAGETPDTRFVAVEPASCPSLTRGRYRLRLRRHGPDLPARQDVHARQRLHPSPDHAGGLRYHGMSPIVSKLKHDGYLEAVAVRQTDVFAAAVEFARLETILPAPESAHAIFRPWRRRAAAPRPGRPRPSSSASPAPGYFDMKAYDAFNRGEMERPRAHRRGARGRLRHHPAHRGFTVGKRPAAGAGEVRLPGRPAVRPRPLGNGRDAGRRRHAMRARRLGWELRRATREPCDGRFRIGRCFCHALSRETVLPAKKEPVWQSSEAFRGAFRKDASRKARSSFWAARCRLPNRLFFGRRGQNRRQIPAFRVREGGLWFRQRPSRAANGDAPAVQRVHRTGLR